MVQIHSPRPILTSLPTYGRQNSKRPPGKIPIANTIDSEHKVPQFRQLETTHVRVSCQDLSNKFKYKKAGRTPTAFVRRPFDSAFLAAIENLVAGLARVRKLPPKFRHRFASRRAINCGFSSSPNAPCTASLPGKKGESVTNVSGTMCCLCLGPLIITHLRQFLLRALIRF